jgi:alpha-ribazole phosphatase
MTLPVSESPAAAPGRDPGAGTGLRLWLVRHAEVDASWRGRAYGDLDVPLSPEGEAATEALAAAFRDARVARVLASPLERAARMGRAIAAATGAPCANRDGLRELFRGAWQGRPTDAIGVEDPDGVAAYYADPWSYRGHGGECDADILARALPVVRESEHDHAGGAVVLATHYNVIRVLAAHLLELAPARSFAFRIDPGRAALLEDRAEGGSSPAGWVLRCSNTARPTHRELAW